MAFKDDFLKYNNKSLTYKILRDNNSASFSYTGPLTLTNNGLEIPIFHDNISNINALILTETPDSESELFQITVSENANFV